MNIIRFSGGLGNQMYQYALKIVLEKKYGIKIKADLNHYNIYKDHNQFELPKVFDLELDIASKKEIKRVYRYFSFGEWVSNFPEKVRKGQILKTQYYVNKFYRIIFRNYRNLITDYNFNIYNDVLSNLNTSKDWYFEGLWQNMNYFLGYEEDIRNKFKFKKLSDEKDIELKKSIEESNSVAIHLRRGDYVGSNHEICSIEYYKKAIELIEKKVKNPKYFIFSDDIEYAKEIFKDLKDKVFIIGHSGNKSYIDMQLMSYCKNNIIPNSTFSFWGAFLNKNKDKIVIAPKYCYRDVYGYHLFSVPENWTVIDNGVK